MKIILLIFAGILILLWGIFHWGFNISAMIHILLAGAILILLNVMVFNDQLSDK